MAYRTFRKIKINTDDYFTICFKIYPFLEQIIKKINIPMENLRWHHIKKYCENELDYTFGNINQRGHISGLTLIYNNEVRIGITTHSSVCKGRQNFSLMHEITHSIVHRDLNSNVQQFASARNSLNQYTTREDIIREIEADICASIMIANDYAIMDLLKQKKTFAELKHEFGCSVQCLEMRLTNFIIYNTPLPFQRTFNIIQLYKANKINLQYFFPETF